MRILIVTSALALTALCGAAVIGGQPAQKAVTAEGAAVEVAAVRPGDAMSDACVWSAEAAAAGKSAQCAEATRPLVWPDDFIALTVSTATEVWQATVDFVGRAYNYAFESEDGPQKAGS